MVITVMRLSLEKIAGRDPPGGRSRRHRRPRRGRLCGSRRPVFKADDFVGVGLDPDGLAVQVAHSEYGYDRNQPVPRYRDESFGCRRRFADEVGYRDARDRLGWKRDRGQPDVWFQFDRDDMRWDGAACVGGVRSERGDDFANVTAKRN